MKKHRIPRAGAKPCRDMVLHEPDHDLLDDYDIADVLQYARKLQGFVPCPRAELKGAYAATVIYAVVRIYNRLRDSGGYKKVAALEIENVNLRRECKRLWKIEAEYNLIKDARTELPMGLEVRA